MVKCIYGIHISYIYAYISTYIDNIHRYLKNHKNWHFIQNSSLYSIHSYICSFTNPAINLFNKYVLSFLYKSSSTLTILKKLRLVCGLRCVPSPLRAWPLGQVSRVLTALSRLWCLIHWTPLQGWGSSV